jgi:nicotinamide-nucleotide amidase
VPDILLPKALVAKAREVVDANRKAGRRIALAESCTGGLVSAAITEIPGASDVFEAGYVTYSDASKVHELKVSEDVVETFGAVSVATAWAMARGALAASDADVAVAVTGIAGPGGGSPAKPVGTVVFARAERSADPARIFADQKLFENENRAGVRLRAALCALDLLMPGDPAEAAAGAEVYDGL